LIRGLSVVVITIGGAPGSGTTTVAEILEKRLDITYIYTGDLFRKKAEDIGMTLTEFGDYVFTHPEIDRELDRSQAELANGGNVILEGRLSGWIVNSKGIPALKVWLTASPGVRAKRVSDREGKDTETIRKQNDAREKQERDRYLEIYQFDIDTMDIYDMVIDTDNLTPDEITDLICERIKTIK